MSSGHTPWVTLRALAAAQIPWPAARVFPVDERVAPAGHADRNLTHLKDGLVEHASLVGAAKLRLSPLVISP